jgi:predicted MFS family arabinose efflux permease
MIYIGQAVGAFTGGALIAQGAMHQLAWVGAAFMAVAVVASFGVKDLRASPQ